MTTPALSNHFADGFASGSPQEPASLQAAGREWTSAADTGYKPLSVLQQVQIAPGNGRSEQDAQRVLPGGRGILRTNNGTSAGTNEALMPLKMAGDVGL